MNQSRTIYTLSIIISLLILLFFLTIILKNLGISNLFTNSNLSINQLEQNITNNINTKDIYINTYPDVVLSDLWETYKASYIQKDGRTIDHSANLITTSEGQSYSLLRAVWSDDKNTFDAVWKWTNVNLKKRTTDSLFAWKWGRDLQGNWGILTGVGGMNTASDADQDIALALILASERWNDKYYLTQAQKTLNDIWNTEVVIVDKRPYLTGGNWAQNGNIVTLNPSYYSFAVYPIFQKVDPTHDWLGVKATSYEVLNNVTQTMPPDWVSLNTQTMTLSPVGINGNNIQFSHDALRIPWRVALDWYWNEDLRAKEYLNKLSFFSNQWDSNKVILSSYNLDGKPNNYEEDLSIYGSLLPYFKVINPTIARQILTNKIAPQFNPDTGDFRTEIGYYNENWVWFGLALYQGKLLNNFQLGGGQNAK